MTKREEKNRRSVILKSMFTIKEIEEDPGGKIFHHFSYFGFKRRNKRGMRKIRRSYFSYHL